GTPAYMAPEQAQGEAVDARSDLFSLGCVLYRMLTGQQPFPGKDTMGVLMALATATPRPVRELAPDLPPALADLVSRLLSKGPQGRPASAKAVAAELTRIEAAMKSDDTTGPLTPAAAPRRRRHRPLALAALLLAALGIGDWFYGVQIIRIATDKGELVV